ncbi:MAG: DUF5691 domain-containing protein [Microscillaceae bacterium]|nr:DUF5691 domain-containing protein [Microscillaceae bacterium]
MMRDKILKIAVLGTEKSFFTEEDQETLKQWQIPENASPEQIFLQSALIYSKMQQAGFLPQKLDAQILPATPESRPAIGAKSMFHLGLMLGGTHHQVLPEFIELVDVYQKRVDFQFLPNLLDWGVAKTDIQTSLSRILGQRGKWLSRLNDQWEYLYEVLEPSQVDWEMSSFKERKPYLRSLRITDPPQATELLEKTWDQEETNHKVGFLKIFAENLSLADEPFLEKLRTERRKEVRALVFQLLAKIPQSRYNHQLRQYLDKHIDIQSNLIKNAIDIKFPHEFDREQKDLGVVEKSIIAKGGQKANWLAQIIVKVHPDFWLDKFQKKPDEIVNLIQKSEWNELLIGTISQAAVFHGDQLWLSAFFDQTHNKHNLNLPELIQALEETYLNRLVEKEIKQGVEALYHNKTLFLLLEYSQTKLSDPNTRHIIKLYQELVRKENRKGSYYQWQTKNLLKKLGLRINPDLLPEIREGWTENLENGDHWFADITEFLRLLEFRKEVKDALKND